MYYTAVPLEFRTLAYRDALSSFNTARQASNMLPEYSAINIQMNIQIHQAFINGCRFIVYRNWFIHIL